MPQHRGLLDELLPTYACLVVVDVLDGLGHHPLAGVAPGLADGRGQVVGEVLDAMLAEGALIGECRPGAQVWFAGQAPDDAAVRLHRVLRRLAALLLRDATDPTGEDEAGGEPLEVPLPGAGHRLVEVVDVHDDVTVGGAVETEVRGMRVPAQLGAQAGRGTPDQVGGLHPGGAPEEGVRRLRHPLHPQREQLRQPVGVRLFDEVDDVGAVLRRDGVVGMGARRGLGRKGSAALEQLGG